MNKITKFVVLVAVCLLGLFSCNEKTSNDYLVYDFRGKYGYVDRKGNVVIEPHFDNAKSFSEGLAWAEKDGKSGYIDRTGIFVIELDAKDGEPFTDGFARVRMGDQNYDIINKKGEVVVDGKQFDNVRQMSEGMVVVCKDKKYGVLDRNGNQIAAPKFVECQDFSDGLAWVKIGKRWGCIDKNGNMVIDTNYVSINGFHEGLAFVWKDYPWRNEAHPVCIDKKGNIVIEELPKVGGEIDHLFFSEGLACIKVNDKYGYIDKTGKFVIEPQFDFAQNFSDGLALIAYEKERVYYGVNVPYNICGYIDKKGKVVIQPKYELADNFSEGLAAVCLKTGTIEKIKYYYIDKNEKMVTDSLFCNGTIFHNGIAEVDILDEGINYVDKNGKLLVNRNLSYLEKLFITGKRSEYSIRSYLLDNVYREALIEKYGKKWYDVLKNQEWDNSRGRTSYNEEDRCYTCVDNTIDEEVIGFMRYYPEKDEVSSALFVLEIPGVYDLEHAIRVMPDGKAQCGNWKEDYFVNEFNEKDYDYPYVYISLPGVYTPENWNVNIRIMYSKEGFRIVQEEDITWDTDIVIRRDSDGQTFRVPYKEYGAGGIVSDYDYCEWISDVLNEGDFTIKVGSTISRVTDETRGFKGAVINMRGGFFSPTPNNASSSSEFHQQSNSGVSQFVVIDGSQLRLRLAPSTSSDTFKWPDGTNRHPNVGDKYRYLGESGDFYKIDFNGNELWVSKQYTHLE
jgi:hypothetical protein